MHAGRSFPEANARPFPLREAALGTYTAGAPPARPAEAFRAGQRHHHRWSDRRQAGSSVGLGGSFAEAPAAHGPIDDDEPAGRVARAKGDTARAVLS